MRLKDSPHHTMVAKKDLLFYFSSAVSVCSLLQLISIIKSGNRRGEPYQTEWDDNGAPKCEMSDDRSKWGCQQYFHLVVVLCEGVAGLIGVIAAHQAESEEAAAPEAEAERGEGPEEG